MEGISSALAGIREKLEWLRKQDLDFRVFGSREHLYRLHRVTVAEVLEFEASQSVTLPTEYREFIATVGAGAGPYYGLWPLSKSFRKFNEDVAAEQYAFRLADSFPITTREAEELCSKKRASPKEFFYAEDERCPLPGCLPISHQGCHYYDYLVVSGEQAGRVWSVANHTTGQGDWLPAGATRQLTFLQWYERWLQDALAGTTDSP